MSCDVGEVTEILENEQSSWIKNPYVKSQSKIYVIIEKILFEIMNKKIRVLNNSQSFRGQHVKISVPYYKQFLRKIAPHKHYFNIGKIVQSGAP